MIIVDDASTDETAAIVKRLQTGDERIQLLQNEKNMRAAVSRNEGIQKSKGQYIAFLDSDDLWFSDKLEKQLAFMKSRKASFSCASYEVVDENDQTTGKQVIMLPESDYHTFLEHNLLQTVGIMVDASVVPISLLHMPSLTLCEDAATWLQILKAGYPCLGIQEILCQYRHSMRSLSGNKLKSSKALWHVYREVERLPVTYCCYCFIRYALLAVWKRLPTLRKKKAGRRR